MKHLNLTILYLTTLVVALTSCENNELKSGRYNNKGTNGNYYYYVEINKSKDSIFFATPQSWDNVKQIGIDTFYNSACIAKSGDKYYLRDFESTIIPTKRDTTFQILVSGDTITLNCQKLSSIIEGVKCSDEYISYVFQ